jgi:hypothetical protein
MLLCAIAVGSEGVTAMRFCAFYVTGLTAGTGVDNRSEKGVPSNKDWRLIQRREQSPARSLHISRAWSASLLYLVHDYTDSLGAGMNSQTANPELRTYTALAATPLSGTWLVAASLAI